ncbi:MAG: DUF5123 domain-containing protein [Rhodothermaceae bacterium]|nr:DUF5123 domain-containing protein [Rhodothermaceae bacterium]MXZ59178.1 DUF5123 domain-containing protein [Rhodothermaceae bacterium]MYB90244.1 DUF5123 domain-containing protein [Rhodothermaceae bacterium]MYD68580.1 DUF5123 domain-containing protein [Rhodothermaceae bacterium]MYG45712.1 DUF5123 domain-containing protein [Rhodothermaceae bacterium]
MRTITTCFGLMIALVFLVAKPAFSQTKIEVEAGQNTLLDAVAAAAPGDTLVLTTDGGQYLNDDELKPDSSLSLTIMAAPGLTNRPVLINNGEDSTKDIIRLYGDMTLIGLEFDGLAHQGLTTKYAIRTGSGSGDAGENVKKNYVLKIFDCYFHDIVHGSDGNAFRAYGQTMADSIIIRNTLVFNTGKEGIRARDEDSDRPGFGFFNVKYFEVSNSTFWNIKNDAISVYGGDQDPNTPGPEVVIDRVTMHNVGHYFLNLKYAENSTVTNTIMVDNYDIVNGTGKTLGAPWLETGATLAYSDTLNVSDDGAWTGGGAPTIMNLYAVDPMFADAANGDFTLMEGSPLIGKGTDGSSPGDSRWAPKTAAVHKISAGQNTLADAVDAAEAGDIIELVDSGGEYLNDDRIDITIPLTIRAAAGLDERPVIKNNEVDESTRVVFEVLNSLHLDGIEIDGQAGTDFNAKYLLRVRGAVDSSTVVKVTNSFLHDVVAGSDGNFLRQYPGTFADSMIFRNSILSGSGKEGIRTKDEETDSGLFNVKYFEVSNTTMANTRASAIYIYSGDTDPATPEPEVIIDHLTCHNCGHSNGRAIYPRGVQTARITNSIIANSLVDEERWSVNLTGTSSISHSNLFMVSKIQLGGSSTQEAISEIDPQFANPDMLDFTLPADSPLLTMGTDGMGIGDMRWITSGVAVEEDTPIPSETDIVLDQNYPNPFNIETTIPYHLGRDGHVTLEVFDLLGRSVARLKDGYDSAGSYSVSLSMQQQGAGTYFYRLTVDGESTWRKLVVVK